MKVTLNKIQLEDVLWRIEMEGIRHYDVKMEMVDHIASEVEEVLKEDVLEYEAVVDEVFSRYKLFHFSDIEKKQVKKLRKQALRLFFSELFQFFNLPKIIITLFVFVFFTQALSYLSLLTLSFVPFVVGLVIVFILIKRKFKYFGKKEFVQLQTLTHYMFFTVLLSIQILIRVDFENIIFLRDSVKVIELYKVYMTSGMFTFWILSIYIGYELSAKELTRLKKQYV